MCTGVAEGIAGVKLCGCVKLCGSFGVGTVRAVIVIVNREMSLL